MSKTIRQLRKEFEDKLIEISGVSRQYANAASFSVNLEEKANVNGSTPEASAIQYAQRFNLCPVDID